MLGVTVIQPLYRPNRLRQPQPEVCTNDTEQCQDQTSYAHIHTTPANLQGHSIFTDRQPVRLHPRCKRRFTSLLRLLKSLGARRGCREIPRHLHSDFYLRDQDARTVGAQKVVGAETGRSTKLLMKDIQGSSLDTESQKDRSQVYLMSTLLTSSGLPD